MFGIFAFIYCSKWIYNSNTADSKSGLGLRIHSAGFGLYKSRLGEKQSKSQLETGCFMEHILCCCLFSSMIDSNIYNVIQGGVRTNLRLPALNQPPVEANWTWHNLIKTTQLCSLLLGHRFVAWSGLSNVKRAPGNCTRTVDRDLLISTTISRCCAGYVLNQCDSQYSTSVVDCATLFLALNATELLIEIFSLAHITQRRRGC